MFFDYCESGSYTEQTFRENSSDFDLIRLRQRIAVDLSDRSTASEMLGEPVSMPIALAPIGMGGMQRADGEIKAAQAAAKKGVPYTLSTMSICSIEDVAKATSAPFWFQLYVMRDEEFVDNIIDRAKAAECSALVLTLDLQLLGQRHKDLKNGADRAAEADRRQRHRPRQPDALALERSRCWAPTGAPSATSSATPSASATSRRCIPGPPSSSTPSSTGTRSPGSATSWGGKLILKGILEEEDARARRRPRRRRAHRVEPRRPAARRRAVLDPQAARRSSREVGDRIEVWLD